ncbi:MAG: type III pantothenate kinase [bacterium]|nr:type III pantothenate kinase [bacterium]
MLSRNQEHWLLAIDIGNSRITIGIYQGSQLQRCFHISTEFDKAGEDYNAWLQGELRQWQAQSEIRNPKSAIGTIRRAVISSVVPPLTPVFVQVVKDCLGIEAGVVNSSVVNSSLDIELKLCYDDPSQLGADRLVNVIAARELYGCPAIVIDLGTAITFDCLSQKGEYLVNNLCNPDNLCNLCSLFARLSSCQIANYALLKYNLWLILMEACFEVSRY